MDRRNFLKIVGITAASLGVPAGAISAINLKDPEHQNSKLDGCKIEDGSMYTYIRAGGDIYKNDLVHVDEVFVGVAASDIPAGTSGWIATRGVAIVNFIQSVPKDQYENRCWARVFEESWCGEYREKQEAPE